KKKRQIIINALQEAFLIKQQKEQKAKELINSIDEYLLNELGIKIPEKDNSLPNRIFTTTFKKVSGNRIDPFFNEPYFLIIYEMLTRSKYPTKKLKDLCYSVRGVTYTSEDEIENEDGIGILRANNIDLQTNQLLLDDIRYIRADFEIPKDKLLYKNDILMSAASGSKEHVGKVALIEQDLEYYFGGFMSVLRVKDNSVLPQYLFSYLQSIIYRTFLFRVLGGTNINNLNFNMISNFLIPVPRDIGQQKVISERIFEIRNKIKGLRIEANEELEKARQQVEKIILEDE
ncbi:MAG TPA: restriction endonuclease subunit S, partial [Candidatus Kapabacteria bacterium]|nr:restriction endonuclease subunit S [Candidatus Kapabacteria bacterium]